MILYFRNHYYTEHKDLHIFSLFSDPHLIISLLLSLPFAFSSQPHFKISSNFPFFLSRLRALIILVYPSFYLSFPYLTASIFTRFFFFSFSFRPHSLSNLHSLTPHFFFSSPPFPFFLPPYSNFVFYFFPFSLSHPQKRKRGDRKKERKERKTKSKMNLYNLLFLNESATQTALCVGAVPDQ